MNLPRFLIIMPTYNAEKTIIRAIESIIHQEYTNWELVIIDDGSIDSTYSLALKYKEFPNITIIRNQQNHGCYYSRNLGLYTSNDKPWDYFTIHDSDDFSSLDRLKIYAEYITCFPKLKYIYSAGEGDRWVHPNAKQFISKTNWVGQSFISRKIFKDIGYFDSTRFGGDAEYVERCIKLLGLSNNLSRVNADILMSKGEFGNLAKKYTYTYQFVCTTSNLTFIYNKQKRIDYQNQFISKVDKCPSIEGLYQNFEPYT